LIKTTILFLRTILLFYSRWN